MSTPSASPSGPAARASEAVTLPGPLPTSRATPPVGMSSQSMGSCHALTSLRANACALSYSIEPSPEAHAAWMAPVFFGGVASVARSVVEQVEVALADVGVGRRIGE